MKFTQKGSIKFGYELENNQLKFHVIDTGVGISDEKTQLIFERFRQASESSTRLYGGTGLGLTISKGLVQLLNGDIWVNSIPDKGSSFHFTIPYIAGKNKTANTNTGNNELQKFNFESKTILIVEDSDEIIEYLIEVFEDTKAKLLFAKEGSEAVIVFTANPQIDLVLMDIQLPGKDGMEIVKYLKEMRRQVPMIAQTAFALMGDKEMILLSGFDDYISKPIDEKELMEKLAHYLYST